MVYLDQCVSQAYVFASFGRIVALFGRILTHWNHRGHQQLPLKSYGIKIGQVVQKLWSSKVYVQSAFGIHL